MFTANDDRDSPPPSYSASLRDRAWNPLSPPRSPLNSPRSSPTSSSATTISVQGNFPSFPLSSFISLTSLFYSAENAVNDRLARTPELYLLALTQFAISADTEVVSTQQTFFHLIFLSHLSLYQMRSFSLVLLRRLLFRPAPAQQQNRGAQAPRLSLYDHLSSSALSTVERLLLHSLSHEPSAVVRRKSVDTITDLANNSMQRGRPWHALQAQAFSMTQSADAGLRESAFRVFAGSSMLVMDLQTDAVLRVLKGGLEDSQSIDVRPLIIVRSF